MARNSGRKLGRAQRLALHVAEDLDAAGAERSDGAVGLADRGVNVVHRHRRDERREPVGMSAADRGKAVIGDARQFRRLRRRPERLDRRIAQRQHMLEIVEFVHQPQPRIDIPERRQLGKRGQRHVAGDQRAQPVEDPPRMKWLKMFEAIPPGAVARKG
jgi:hypothetical protein